MNENLPTDLTDLRAQQATLERQIAEASLPAAQAYAALLGSSEVDQLMTAITASAEQLDDTTRNRITVFAKMRSDLVILANADVSRMQKLAAAEAPTVTS